MNKEIERKEFEETLESILAKSDRELISAIEAATPCIYPNRSEEWRLKEKYYKILLNIDRVRGFGKKVKNLRRWNYWTKIANKLIDKIW